MKKLYTIMKITGRLAVVCFMLAALLISGAGAAERVITRAQADDTVIEEISVTPALDTAPPTADELPGKMASKTRPNCEQPALLSISYSITPDQGSNKNIKYISLLQPHQICAITQFEEKQLCSTLASVDTALSHKLTLVGHKPSGTI